jgi:polyisoprenoid-binding protein YceI
MFALAKSPSTIRLSSILTGLVLLLLSHVSVAQMTLDEAQSSLSFMSTKNTNISEQHTFDRFSGKIDTQGKLLITIDMTSVNTMIPIRNERMQSMLFSVSDYSEATFTASIPKALTKLSSGEHKMASIDGTMTIAGNSAPVSFKVAVTGLSNGGIAVSTRQPTVLSASTFKLDEGIAALKEIAGLQSISSAVPLSFSVVFAGQ